MSSATDVVEEYEAPAPHKPAPGSLEERVAKRRTELEKRQTEKFDVPGFEGIFQVELQVVGGKRQYQLGLQHEHVHDEYQQSLRTAADLIAAATVGFHMVVDEEGGTERADDCTWKKLAAAYDKTLQVDLIKTRVALIRLLGEEGVLTLASEWKLWLRTRGVKVEQQLEDFS